MIKLDGRKLALEMRETLKSSITSFKKQFGRAPCLAVVLVGEDPASQVYVKNKMKACEAVGLVSIEKIVAKDISQEALVSLVQSLNEDPHVNGILVQLPLPTHLHESAILDAIHPLKDVDGLTNENLGLLLSGRKRVAPCTPHGVIRLLKKNSIQIKGQKAVVIGRSQIVGKPMALLLLEENATVTICHSQTQNLKEHIKEADIIVVAAGQPEFLGADDFNKNAVVIDVGIHRQENGKLCGDVRYSELENKVKAITPVPGGVGPMTIAMLLENTYQLSLLQMENQK